MTIELTVPESFCAKDNASTMRLDAFVASEVKGMNRSHLKSCAKEIYVNGKKAKLSAKIKPLDKIKIECEEIIPCAISPEDIPLKIIYEDEGVAVVNKASGMVTHPASGNWQGTLVNALLFHWHKDAVSVFSEENCDRQKATLSPNIRQGIVHRLDKDTSGVIITAKNRVAHEWLAAQFLGRHIKKEYLAIVQGRPQKPAGDVRTQIVRDPKNRKRFVASEQPDKGKFARTLYKCVAYYGNYTVVRVRLKTGRTHQIRVHMKHLGCPILGDELYAKRDNVFPTARLMLHSRLLAIRLPHSKKQTVFRAGLPEHFVRVHEVLQKKYDRIAPHYPKSPINKI